MSDKYRNWCFTWHYDEPVTPDFFEAWVEGGNARYVVVGDEIAPTTGSKHYQGYVQWKNPRALGGLKKINKKIHWLVAIGNAEQNHVYSSKEFLFCEFGSPTAQGKRNDIASVRECLTSGGSMHDIVMETTSYQAARFGELFLRHYNGPKRNWVPEVYWHWGPSGAGKTRSAFEQAPNAWMSAGTLKWWDGYNGQADVIIDDFRKDFCTFHELLRILDRYPYRVQIKGSSTELLAKRIFITSCYHPQKVYDTREDLQQLLRRITRVIHFPGAITAPTTSVPIAQRGTEVESPSGTSVAPFPAAPADSVPPEQKSGGNTRPPTSLQVMTMAEIDDYLDDLGV